MSKSLIFLFVLTFAIGSVFAETPIEKIDRMHDEELHRKNYAFIIELIDTTPGNTEKAELYWRLSRTVLEIGDLLIEEQAEEEDLLNTFIEGEGYADRAIELNPQSYRGYYWKSANMGRWGEARGILNALFIAKPMRELLHQALSINPEDAVSFYVLGIMYRKVPGRPISFGNSDKAVSLGRKAVDAQRREFETGKDSEIKLSFFMELSRSLYKRNWRASKRRKAHGDKAESYRRERDVLDKNFNYEGALRIPDVSDREEATEIMAWVISEYKEKSSLRPSEKVYLEEALADFSDWTD